MLSMTFFNRSSSFYLINGAPDPLVDKMFRLPAMASLEGYLDFVAEASPTLARLLTLFLPPG